MDVAENQIVSGAEWKSLQLREPKSGTPRSPQVALVMPLTPFGPARLNPRKERVWLIVQ